MDTYWISWLRMMSTFWRALKTNHNAIKLEYLICVTEPGRTTTLEEEIQ